MTDIQYLAKKKKSIDWGSKDQVSKCNPTNVCVTLIFMDKMNRMLGPFIRWNIISHTHTQKKQNKKPTDLHSVTQKKL